MRMSDWSSDVCSSDLSPSPAPGQKPALASSCEYASCITQSAQFGAPPGCRGAPRPEKRVTARSKAPQKKCEGLDLPWNRARNTLNTRSRSEEHTSELQSLMRNSYAVFCLKKKKKIDTYTASTRL